MVQAKQEVLKEGESTGQIVIFCSTRGVCIGANNGVFKNITQTYYTYPYGATNTALLRHSGGHIYYLANLDIVEDAFNQDVHHELEVDQI